MKCEMCNEREADHWVLIDENMETELCNRCIRDLCTEVPVKVLEV